jgi:tetratricopeptide (TPR) repeat protein
LRSSLVLALLVIQSCTYAQKPLPPAPDLHVPASLTPPTQSETLALLNSNQFEELDQRFAAIQRDYKNGAISDEKLRAAFRVFYSTDEALEPKYDAWVARFPKSYVALLARGIYYKKVGMERRGGDFIANTTDAQLSDMKTAFAMASRDLHASVELDDKPLLTYLHAMDVSNFLGDSDQSRELLRLSIKLDPGNFIVREKYMGTLEPRWGGSLDQMYAFLDESKEAGLSAAHLELLEGVIVEDQALTHKEAGDYAAAERDYRKAIAMGREDCLLCLSQVLLKQQKYEEVIPVFSKMLAADPNDIAVVENRGIAYMRIGRTMEALADFKTAADSGAVYSQNELGRLNMIGIPGILPVNSAAGVAWFRKAAAQGNEAGIRNLQTALGNPVVQAPQR